MFKILLIQSTIVYSFVFCASYNRYDSTDRYGSQYTTINNLNQYPYKYGYSSDIARFPNDNSRYPNYTPNGYTTKSYYNSGTLNYNNNGYPGSSNNQYYSGSTPRYGDGFSSYEYPFMKNEREYCMNRSPQNGIYVENLMGMWYGVEYIHHLAGDSRVDYTRTCIVMHLSEPAEQVSGFCTL